tara:strand:+ start:1177 stop:1356 length:180 start_codon:yes stop_codon:yes gene_type:complete
MLYQIGIILIFVAIALIISKKFMNNDNENLVYEDEMDEEELKKIDEELDQSSNSSSRDL